ncbi:hypothetical protein AB670_00044 [Chryseobacterium sp. MOF25P]|nr:hypothetical protein AB670_00044 [Chryseobacterium sp. MOF25P]OBW46712.1 hypothetical protein AB671_01207 [Chryseobacterium sp. BGARF1]
MTIKIQLQSDQIVYLNTEHIIYVVPVDEGCQIFLSNDKSFWSTESAEKVNTYIQKAYTFIHRSS